MEAMGPGEGVGGGGDRAVCVGETGHLEGAHRSRTPDVCVAAWAPTVAREAGRGDGCGARHSIYSSPLTQPFQQS
jgi:hypothetical protein